MAIQSRSNVPVFIYCLLSHPSAGHTIYTLKTDIRKQECAVNSDRRPEKIDHLVKFMKRVPAFQLLGPRPSLGGASSEDFSSFNQRRI